MILSIIVGLCIFLVVPLLFKDKFGRKKKNQYKALTMVCKIIGIAIIVVALLNHYLGFLN